MTVYDDITDEMLEHVIKSDGLVSTPFYKDICAELLQRRQADRWIPVEERLPEEGEYVSVLFGKDEKTIGSWFTETETEEYETIGFEYKQWEVWNFGDNKFRYVDDPPTHWRPLPAPPEVP